MADESLMSIPAEITKVESKPNGAFRLQVDSQENIPAEMRSRIFNELDKMGYFCFLPELRPIAAEEVVSLPPLKLQEDETKTPSQRLRAVIYLLAKKRNEADTELFYRRCMEKLIDQIKDKLD